MGFFTDLIGGAINSYIENKDADDTFNYECWYWEDIDISCFCVFKDKLYFGTNDGKYCLLNNCCIF